jgi:hypothetical protein
MFQSFHERQYGFAALFGAMLLLFNPLLPTFVLSGNQYRLILFVSVLPFAASLTWTKTPVLTAAPAPVL